MDCLDERAGQPLDDSSLTPDIAASRGEGTGRRKDLQLDSAGEKSPARSLYRERAPASSFPAPIAAATCGWPPSCKIVTSLSGFRPAIASALRVKVSASEPYCAAPIIAAFKH